MAFVAFHLGINNITRIAFSLFQGKGCCEFTRLVFIAAQCNFQFFFNWKPNNKVNLTDI